MKILPVSTYKSQQAESSKYSQKPSFCSNFYLRVKDQFLESYSQGDLAQLFKGLIPDEQMEKFAAIVNRFKVAAEGDRRGKNCDVVLKREDKKLFVGMADTMDVIAERRYPVENLDELDENLTTFINKAGTIEWLGLGELGASLSKLP